MKRKLLIGIVAVMVFAFGGGNVAAQSDFSGVWTLDSGKSANVPPGLMQTMTVTQNGDRVEIETKSKAGEGQERVGKDAYVLDGKETDFTMGRGAKKAKRLSKWTNNGNSFDVTEEFVVSQPDGSEATVRANHRWILSADGKTLTIERVVENPNGASKPRSRSRRVFVKN
ncbi:MAG: hypothetical protein LC768_13840 [Acidobacteria bacterium]|nr:hypothetical protein [Acidobacteriota bacterium]MCA1639393.1 hypothetical protein [Acidobacteriota bacterium]